VRSPVGLAVPVSITRTSGRILFEAAAGAIRQHASFGLSENQFIALSNVSIVQLPPASSF
jgi:hypothetical protein